MFCEVHNEEGCLPTFTLKLLDLTTRLNVWTIAETMKHMGRERPIVWWLQERWYFPDRTFRIAGKLLLMRLRAQSYSPTPSTFPHTQGNPCAGQTWPAHGQLAGDSHWCFWTPLPVSAMHHKHWCKCTLWHFLNSAGLRQAACFGPRAPFDCALNCYLKSQAWVLSRECFGRCYGG